MGDQDIERIVRRMARAPMNRRGFLKAGSLSASAAFLAACSGGGGVVGAPRRPRRAPPRRRRQPVAGRRRRPPRRIATEGALFMYNWAEYIDLGQHRRVQDALRHRRLDVRHLRLERGADDQAPGRRDRPVRHRLRRRPSSSRSMADEGFIAEARLRRASRTPRSSTRRSRTSTIPPAPDAKYNKYHVPKDWGTTGIAVRTKVVTEEVKTWKQFFEVAPKYSGRIVDGRLGRRRLRRRRSRPSATRSTRPTRPSSARRASCCRASRRTSWPSTRTTTTTSSATEEAVLGLVWTGGVVDLREEPETADTEYIIPEDGTLYWLDTWVMFADAPHPEAGLRLAQLHPGAGDPGQGDRDQPLRHANDEAKKLVGPEILNDPTVFVPDEASRPASRARRTSRPTRSASRSGRSSGRASAAEPKAVADADDERGAGRPSGGRRRRGRRRGRLLTAVLAAAGVGCGT